MSEYPPMYFGLMHRLRGQDEYGYALTLDRAKELAIELREYVLNRSEWKEDNRRQWQAFIKDNPHNEAAVFIGEILCA